MLSNIIELIDIFKLYRFMVTESIYFHIMPRLSWYESYKSLGESRPVGPFTSRLTVAFHPNQWFRRKAASGAKASKNSGPHGRVTLG